MTVTNTNRDAKYTGTGANTALPTTFTFIDSDDVQVISRVTATGADTTLTEGVHYNVTGGDYATGTVTPIDGATDFPSTVTWTLKRVTDRTQQTDYVENDAFPAESHEQALDKLTYLQQEASEDADRALKFRSTESGVTTDLPASDDLQSMYLGVDSTGKVPVALAAPAGTTSVSSFWATVLTLADAATSRGASYLDAQEDVTTTKGDVVVGNASGAASRKAVGSNGQILTADSTESDGIKWDAPINVVAWPPYYESGFAMSGPTATAWEFNIGKGSARAHTTPGTTDNTFNGTLASGSFTKKLDGSAWAAGSGANGLADGATAKAANGWYPVFGMWKSTDLAAEDVGLDSDLDAANLRVDSAVVAAGFNRFRLIGFVRVNSGNSDVEPFVYNPASGYWQFLDRQFITGSFTTQAPLTLTAGHDTPIGDVDGLFVVAGSYGSGNAGGATIRHVDGTDAPTSGVSTTNWTTDAALSDGLTTIREGIVRINSSKQIDVAITGNSAGFGLALRGFYVDRSAR